MKQFTAIAFLFALAVRLSGQSVPEDIFRNMDMRAIGPAVTSGRVTAIDVHPQDPQRIYTGTASGGVWRSRNGGTTWEPLFDDQEVLGIGSLKIDPSNPDILWVGTGEGNPRNSQTSGKGIYRSPDGGRSWEYRGLSETRTIHRICVNPRNSDIVLAGAMGSAWGPNPDRGVFRTTDGGSSWSRVLFVNDSVGCADLVMDPENPEKLFAAMWQYGRQPWFFNSGGKGSGLYMTLDGGKNWKKLDEKNGLPEGPLGRIGIAIAPGDPSVVYALVEAKKTGLYKSTDGGFHWELVTTEHVDDRPFYYHEIYVDPSNAHHLIYLHSTVSESIDGGKTWKTLLPYWGVHPDHHAFWWSRTDPEYMIEGNDGGLNVSRDGGQNWQFAANLPLGQFYHINYDMDIPYHVYGGMQDNGSWKGPGYVWQSDGIMSSDWQEVLFGDGFDVVPDPASSRYVYAMYQGGNVSRVDTETGDETYIRPVHPEGTKLRFNWNSAIAQDPFNESAIYYGSQFVHYSTDRGNSWTILSEDLTTNDPARQQGSRSGGLTIDATSAESFCTILCIAPSPVGEAIWVGTDDGKVHVSFDRGKAWKDVSAAITGMPKGAWVPQIVPSPHNVNEAFVVVNDYRRNNWKPYLFHTTDGGKSWKNLVDEKKVSGHCLSVAQDPAEPKLLFLGMEHGLYVSVDKGTTWTRWKNDYPAVATQDLKIHPREHDLIIGTFGRAAFILDDIRPLRRYAREGKALLEKKIAAVEPPVAYMASYKRHRGERFYADAAWVGENKQGGAVLTYFFKPEKADKDAKEKKVTVSILDASGDTVRWFTHEPDTGVNRLSWNFDKNFVRFPSRKKPDAADDPPGGFVPVAPGIYKVVFAFNEAKDSTQLRVEYDPRLTYDAVAAGAVADLEKRFGQSVDLAARTFRQLRDARETIANVRQSLVLVPDSSKKQLLAQADSLTKTIDELELKFMDAEGTRGITDDSEKLVSRLWNTAAYLDFGSGYPGNSAGIALTLLERDVRVVADEVNAFFDGDWIAWQKEVEAMERPLFQPRPKL